MAPAKHVIMLDTTSLHQQVEELIGGIDREGGKQAEAWAEHIVRPEFSESARNLANYLALRHRDLRPLQRPLMALGLSSLGRLESRVLPTLMAVRAALAALARISPLEGPSHEAFFAGERCLADRKRKLLGSSSSSRPVALLVTCPSEAADDPSFMLELAQRGVEAIRINCAHDTVDHWARMIRHARAAEQATGQHLKIMMDLAGPKIRTGELRVPENQERIGRGARLAIAAPGQIDRVPAGHLAVECTLQEALHAVKPEDHIFIDDGKLGAKVERVEKWGVLTHVTSAPGKGYRLKPEKGLNFPDAELKIAALTEKDQADLGFVATHADGIGFSFVQSAADVSMLQRALARHRPDDWQALSLILKVETPNAVRNLPDMVVRAAGRQPTGIMIARGDLAVAIGFTRMAEMQEEILWIGEAAHVPVIWATEVLEHLVKKGIPSRGEMTDAAMAARAECVMLNKGPYLFDAITELDTLLGRMEQHQHKKTALLRRLKSW